MLVNIDEIKEGGLRRAWDLPREAVDAMVSGDPVGYRARGPLHLEGDFKKIERRVLFGASGQVQLTAPCGRCLTPVGVDVPLDFQLTFVPRESVAQGEDTDREGDAERSTRKAGSFTAEDVNEETYAGKVIDVDPVVREQVVLSLPMCPVCQESCKGLCSVCGANLNERDCGCDRHVPDPRWAGLEKLRRKSKEE
jgi:uncharacterized protein